jgi:hypothetical protein
MVSMSPNQYAIAMRQIEGQRNAACRQGDRVAIRKLLEQGARLNRHFFHRDPGWSWSPMTKNQAAAAEIKKIVKNQLADVKRAIDAGTRSIALFELEDAAQRLKKIAALLES